MTIAGSRIKLRPARLSERRMIYTWLAKSDLTPSLMGPPDYPDSRVPTLKEFSQDYQQVFSTPAATRPG